MKEHRKANFDKTIRGTLVAKTYMSIVPQEHSFLCLSRKGKIILSGISQMWGNVTLVPKGGPFVEMSSSTRADTHDVPG
jgi:hypothetical protein